jgi:hypothetical protein
MITEAFDEAHDLAGVAGFLVAFLLTKMEAGQ